MRWSAVILLVFGCSKAPPPAAPLPPDKVADAAPAPTAVPAPDTEPGIPAPTDDQLVALEEAKTAADDGNVEAALKAYLRAAGGPSSGAALSARLAAADIFQIKGDMPRSKALYLGLLKDAADLPEVQFAAARFFAVEGDIPRAIEGFKACIAGQPDLLPAYPLLGALLAQTDRGDEAAELMTKYEVRLNRMLRAASDGRSGTDARLDIIGLLGVLDDERASDTLRALLEDGEPAIRTTAAAYLADEPSAENLVALSKAAVAEKNPVARRVITAALARARDAARGAPPPPPMPAPAPTPSPNDTSR